MKKTLVRWLSQAVNAFRLRGDRSHKKNIDKSRAILAKLATFEHDGQALVYLRKISPYTFEELILTILESRGVFVLRSASYSNDGGIDGRFLWPGKGWHAIQCKRYGQAITPSHARDFARVCAARFKGGLFAHTGRTGDSSQEALAPPGLALLSGSDLARCARDKRADPLALADARKLRADARVARAAQAYPQAWPVSAKRPAKPVKSATQPKAKRPPS